MSTKPNKLVAENQSKASITLDGIEYKLDKISGAAKNQLSNIKFVDLQIRQLQNEWAIADTARLGYQAALKGEFKKTPESR